MNIILGIYYNETVDSQRSVHAPSDSYEYFEKWHKSIKSLNLKAVILHDNSCSKSFCEQYEDDNLSFSKSPKYSYYNDCNFFNYSTKFLDIYEYLKLNKYDKVLITDISDVIIKKNPFELINENNLIIGSESREDGHMLTPKDTGWHRAVFGSYVENYKCFWDKYAFNAGILGGSYNTLTSLLKSFQEKYSAKSWTKTPMDGFLISNIVHTEFSDRFQTGLPVHSVFKKYENNHPEAYIVHK